MLIVFNITAPNISYDAQVKSRITKIDMSPFSKVIAENLQIWFTANEKEVKNILNQRSIVCRDGKKLKAVDFVVEGLDKAKSVMIITEKEEEICDALSYCFGYGVTQIHATGYYSGKSRSVIYFVVNRFQVAKMQEIVHEIDKKAYITISEVADVFANNQDNS